MIFGRWGSFGRFIMLTAGIGAASSVTLFLFFAAIGGWNVTAEDVEILPLFVAVGTGLGLFMGAPAYWVMRVFVRWIPSRRESGLFFFALGAASVVVSLAIVTAVSGGNLASLFTVSEAGDLLGLPVTAAIGGIFTAVSAPLVLRPAPDSLNHPSYPRHAESATE